MLIKLLRITIDGDLKFVKHVLKHVWNMFWNNLLNMFWNMLFVYDEDVLTID